MLLILVVSFPSLTFSYGLNRSTDSNSSCCHPFRNYVSLCFGLSPNNLLSSPCTCSVHWFLNSVLFFSTEGSCAHNTFCSIFSLNVFFTLIQRTILTILYKYLEFCCCQNSIVRLVLLNFVVNFYGVSIYILLLATFFVFLCICEICKMKNQLIKWWKTQLKN